MLGTFAHRAVLMAFQKPWTAGQVLNIGIVNQAVENAELICDAASVGNPAAPWSRLRAVIDPGGPNWARSADDFVALTAEDRAWVLAHLPAATRMCAEVIAADDKQQRYALLRSEVRMNPIDSTDRSVIADLVAITADGRLVIVDLKFTNGTLPVNATRHADYVKQVRGQVRLARLGMQPRGRVEGWLLYLSYAEGDHVWSRVV